MSLVGNILWILLGGGLIIFLEYVLAGIGMCLTIVGIPWGFQSFKLGVLALWPFGKDVVSTKGADGALPTVLNVVWLIVGGVWIALSHVVLAIFCGLTIIGIPFALQHLKLAELAIWPFGKDIRDAG